MTELQGEKIDMRMKPDWFNDSSVAQHVAMAQGNYKRHVMILQTGRMGYGAMEKKSSHSHNKWRKERKSHPTINRANS